MKYSVEDIISFSSSIVKLGGLILGTDIISGIVVPSISYAVESATNLSKVNVLLIPNCGGRGLYSLTTIEVKSL